MKKFKLFMMTILLTTVSATFAAKNNFQFQINGYHTQRQYGQTLDIYIRYALKDDTNPEKYPDYRDLRKVALRFLEPTAALPTETYWEIISAKIGDTLMAGYPLSGVSIQLLVYPHNNNQLSEPGFHGPIYTVGDVIPLNQIITYKLDS